ncbi:MAG: cytochrome C [Burkholderiales bacterium PBB1]|nr:MAG: cytochrome C [Burkholderiales bacterium PBB1]
MASGAWAQSAAPKPQASKAAASKAAPAPAAAPKPVVDYGERYTAVCAACHGGEGRSEMPQVPSLAGQHSFYVVTQLFLFRDGRRNDHPMGAAMSAMAKGMSDGDLRGYSEAIARLPAAALTAASTAPGAPPRDAARFERGRQLTTAHRCTSCHGPDLAGGGQVPRLAGQREDYLQIALKGFQGGTRLGYTPAMNEALSGLTAQDLDDLAHYISGSLSDGK